MRMRTIRGLWLATSALALGAAAPAALAQVPAGPVQTQEQQIRVATVVKGLLTVKLPRSTLLTIKEIRFKPAKGQAISASRTGSGWMGDEAEISYRIPAAVKTANLELDVWQNLREQTGPFNLNFGLS